MRQSLAIGVASVLLLGVVDTAHAKLIGFNGTLNVGLPGLRPVVATGSGNALLNGSVGGLGGHLTTLQILTNSVSVTGAIVPITDPAGAPLISIRGSAALGMGVLRPISGAAASGTGLTQDVLPVAGLFRICPFPGCLKGVSLPIPLTVGGTRGVGVGGLITLGTFGKAGIKFSIYGQPWTVKTALVTGIPTDNGGFSTASALGFAHGPASATSSTAAVSGVVQLVTATRVVSSLGITLITPLFATLTLHLVPEPGTFVLFGSGVVALGIAGRRRLRKK
ncbi:MAG: PEP-CTERM sorting domain-containing protein [Myxococcota bacterium]